MEFFGPHFGPLGPHSGSTWVWKSYERRSSTLACLFQEVSTTFSLYDPYSKGNLVWRSQERRSFSLECFFYEELSKKITYSLGSTLVWKSQERSSLSLVCLFQEVNRLF